MKGKTQQVIGLSYIIIIISYLEEYSSSSLRARSPSDIWKDMLCFDRQIGFIWFAKRTGVSMKEVTSDKAQAITDADIRTLNEDHKAIFAYIKKLKSIVNKPENHQYASGIVENFIAYFLEHVIKEEQLLQKYLPDKVVADHISLHENELNYLDEYFKVLNVNPSSQNIQRIALKLNQEFKNHINRYDNDILQQLKKRKTSKISG